MSSEQQNPNFNWGSILLSFEKLALFGFVFTLPLPNRFNGIFILLLVISSLLNKRYSAAFNILTKSKVYICMAAYYLALLISLMYTENTHVGIKALETKLSLVAIPILLSGLPWTLSLRNSVLRVFIVSVTIVSLFSIVSTIIYYEIDFTDWSYFSWVLTETIGLRANHYSNYVVFALLFLIVGFKKFRLFKPSITIVVSIYLMIFLGLLSSRMAIFLFILIVLVYLVFVSYKSNNVREKVVLLSTATGIVLIMILAIKTIPYLRDRVIQATKGVTGDPRYFINKASFSIISKNPYLGVGIGDVQEELNAEYKRINFTEGLEMEYNAHNDWTTSYLAAGFLGIFTLLVLYLSLARSILTSPGFFKIAFMSFFFFASQTEAIFNRNKGVLLFSFLVTLIFILQAFRSEADNNHV